MKLLQHFKELTVHPKNAKELKGLILQLAIQGKLTKKWRAQNPTSFSSDDLKKIIDDGKVKVLEKSGVKREKPIDIITEEDIKFELPTSWVWTRFASTAYIVRGGSPRPIKSFLTDDPNGLNWIKIGDTKGATKYIESCAEKIIPEGLKKSRYVEPGDFILSNSMSFGKPYIMKTDGCIHDGWLLIREVKEAINQDYLYFLLLSPYTYSSFKESAAGGVVQNLNIEKVRQTLLPIPPLEEQKAIVNIVNQLFTEVEALEQESKARVQLKDNFVTSALQQLTIGDTTAQWSFLQMHFKTFFTEKTGVKKLRESILQLAVQGKLTQHWRTRHPELVSGSHSAKALLEKIKAEKNQLIKDKKIKKEKPLPEITEDEIPYVLPDGWTWCRMQDLCPNISSGSTPPKPYFKESGIPYLKVYNIRNQKIEFSYKEQFVDEEYHLTKLKRSILKPGDVIMNIVGPPLGKVAIIPDDFPEWNCNQAISFFQPLEKKLNQWIYTFLIAGTFLKHIELIGTAGQDNISVTKSKMIMVPLPPFEEQKAIVAKVKALMGLCDSLEQQIEQSTTQVEQLMQTCLKEVFEGEKQLVE